MSSTKIGKLYNCSHKPILKALRYMNVEIDKNGKKFKRKYGLNEHYFDAIDSQNKAYILGFLWADGNNSIDKSTISMSLQEEDRPILELIRNEIQSEKPLEFLDYSNKHDFGYSYKNQFRLNMFSSHMSRTLEKLGMVSNKSLLLEFPNIDKELFSHFIRGYFDGDGTINKKGGTITIVSTYNFVMKVKEILESQCGISDVRIIESPCKNGITHNLSIFNKRDSKLFLDWIYNDANLYLERKNITYKNIYYSMIANEQS